MAGDGRTTAGYQASRAKNNTQLRQGDPLARDLCDTIVKALQQIPLFIAAALPLRIFPPLFNRYMEGESFGTHVDGSIRQVPEMQMRLRTDLSTHRKDKRHFFGIPELQRRIGRFLWEAGFWPFGHSITPPRRALRAIRHTFATEYIRRGSSQFMLMKVLGHTSLEMTKKYANFQADDLSAVHNRLSLLAR